MRIRVAFLVRRLERGGAERQLIELARGLDKARFDVSIVTLYSGGAFESEVSPASGIRLVSLDKSGRYDVLGPLRRLVRTLRALRPHVVHGYMGGANELSTLGRLFGARVVWGLRATDLRLVPQTRADRALFRAGAWLSGLADCIIANSESVRAFHAASGYAERTLTVIPNGIDTQRFSISPDLRGALRREWMVADHEILVGRAARFHPMKDYPSFLRAAGIVGRAQPTARFACVGDGTDCDELRQAAAREGIGDRVIWAGGRSDMPAVYNAFDLSVSSSVSGEGFPNALAESMACGTPCVATDVGDSATVVDGMGVIVEPSKPEALAAGILQVALGGGRYSRERVRQRITERFASHLLIARTAAELERLALAGPGGNRERVTIGGITT